jgi:hypothetical protein
MQQGYQSMVSGHETDPSVRPGDWHELLVVQMMLRICDHGDRGSRKVVTSRVFLGMDESGNGIPFPYRNHVSMYREVRFSSGGSALVETMQISLASSLARAMIFYPLGDARCACSKVIDLPSLCKNQNRRA